MSPAAAPPLRLALIGVDSSHSAAITRLLGDGSTGAVPGATVVAAWKAPTSQDLPPSRDRNDALAAELEQLGVPLRASPEEAAAGADLLLVLTADPRTHPDLVVRLAPHGLPLYVLTRFALDVPAAERMLAAAHAGGSLVLAGSPKRFDPGVRALLGRADAARVTAVELHGPLPAQDCLPPLAWYGIHLIDLAVATLGPAWERIHRDGDALVLTWEDGRTARISGPAAWQERTGITVHRADGTTEHRDVIARPALHVGLLDELIRCCREGRPSVPEAEILAGVRILEAATALGPIATGETRRPLHDASEGADPRP